MSGRRTPHEVLGVSLGASADEIRAARRQLAREHHPDQGHLDVRTAVQDVSVRKQIALKR